MSELKARSGDEIVRGHTGGAKAMALLRYFRPLIGLSGIGLVLAVALTLASGEIYEWVDEADGASLFDRPVLNAVLGLRSPSVDAALTAFTYLGGPIGMTIIASVITIVMVWRWRARTPLVLMLIAVAGSLTLTSVGKTTIGRSRPPLADAVPPFETSPSFPSGHALNSTVIAGLIAYLVIRHVHARWAKALAVILAVAWAVSMGLSRVFLGHHWLTDVMVGWSLGLAWLAAIITAHAFYLHKRSGQSLDPAKV